LKKNYKRAAPILCTSTNQIFKRAAFVSHITTAAYAPIVYRLSLVA